MKNRLLLFVFIFVTFSCSEQEKKENTHTLSKEETTEAYQEAMVIHDEVMPKMDDIMKLKKLLKISIDSLAAEKQVDTGSINILNPLVVELEEADKAMMDWMHQFDGSKKSDTSQEAATYYSSQKNKITNVANQMNIAIKKAEEALD